MAKKNYNLELIRTVSFVMVILIHVTNYFCRAYGVVSKGEYLFSLLLNTVSRVSVPCFFMLSGVLLLGRTEEMRKNGERILRFFAVLVFWSLVYYFFNNYYRGTEVRLSDLFFKPAEQHLWYLYAMIPIYFVLPFFQIMCRGMNEKVDRAFWIVCSIAVLITFTSSFFGRQIYYDIPIMGDRVYAFYFFAGYYLNKYKKRLVGHGKLLLALSLAGITMTMVLTIMVSAVNGDHYERLLEYGCPPVIVSGITFFAYMLQLKGGEIQPKARAVKWMDMWCSCSFGIYLIHILFLDIYKQHMDAAALSVWVAVPALTVGLLLVSFVCIYSLRKTAVGRHIT